MTTKFVSASPSSNSINHKNSDDDHDNETVFNRLRIDNTNIEQNVKFIYEIIEYDAIFTSPIDINVIRSIKINLPLLCWVNYDQMPKKIKLTNTGKTLILSAKWKGELPYLLNGPLYGKYIFTQIHFHWGKTALEGSEHTIDTNRMPLEMHVIHFNRDYLNLDEALQHPDGVITLVYMFQIRSQHSVVMHRIVSALSEIRMYDTAIAIEPFLLTQLLHPFESDYYLYWGSIDMANNNNKNQSNVGEMTMKTTPILWMITRHIENISFEQICLFRQLLDAKLKPIIRNWRNLAKFQSDQCVFHVNPTLMFTNSTLSPVSLRRV